MTRLTGQLPPEDDGLNGIFYAISIVALAFAFYLAYLIVQWL